MASPRPISTGLASLSSPRTSCGGMAHGGPPTGSSGSLACRRLRAITRSRRRFGGLAAILHGLPFLPAIEDLACRAALELADDAILGHEVDEPGRATVPD